MSLDALGHSPRRVAKPPPPPVPPKRYQVKDLQDLPLPLSSSPDARKQSAVERLAADKAKYVKNQPGAVSKAQPIKALPVMCTSHSSGQSQPSPQKPMRKVAPTPGTHSGGPLLDMQHLTNLINGVDEPPSPPASQTAAQPIRKVVPTPGSHSGGPQLDLQHLTNLINGVDEPPSPPASQTAAQPIRKVAPTPGTHSGGPLLDMQHLTNLINGVDEPPSPPASQTAAQPIRKVVPTPGTHSGGPQLDLQHLTNLINGVDEPPSPPASQMAAASSSSQSSEGGSGGGDENCGEAATPAASTLCTGADKLPPDMSTASTPSEPLSPASSSLCSLLRVAPDTTGSQGAPAVTVRRVDVKPQMAQVRKGMRVPLQSRMPGQRQMQMQMRMQRPMAHHAQPQSQAQLMYFRKAQMASKNAPLVPTARLSLSNTQAVVGVMAGATNPGQPCPTLQLNSNGCPPPMSPTAPIPPQPGSATSQNSSTTPPAPPQCTTSLAGDKPAGQPTRITPVPPLPSPLSPFLQVGANSPLPSPCPSITRLSSTSSRKRPSLRRSKSDVSDCFSRADVDLERFFNYCGLDPADLDLEELTQAGSDIASVSRLRSASAPASECSQAQENEDGDDNEGDTPRVQRNPYDISVIERNARVIKWLYGMRQVRDTARVANI
ncbi:formin-like protein 5 isoform X2 [Alosa sapidissima]|uniref:formin-like protein 5 isoform X2 n=1 Tax=Alosa sapidissima TaxID=34773 RepID=UPI001C092A64|nr:formin-like protein 5 isoform X2 [Alosa sapidissima]